MTATIRTLSLGAGVQSTALVLLSCEGAIKPFDVAIFADTGWGPKKVYDHLDRLTEYAAQDNLRRLEAELAEPALFDIEVPA